MIFPVVAMFVFLFSSCNKDEENFGLQDSDSCRDIELKNIKLSDESEEIVDYKDEKKYRFVNQHGHTVTFESELTRARGEDIVVEVIGERDSFLGGKVDCTKHYRTNNKKCFLESDDIDYHLKISAYVDSYSSTADALKEVIHFSLIGDEGVTGFYRITDDDFDYVVSSTTAKQFDSIQLNGRGFSNVLRAKKVANNAVSILYLQKEKGIIGFEVEGNVYVLD